LLPPSPPRFVEKKENSKELPQAKFRHLPSTPQKREVMKIGKVTKCYLDAHFNKINIFITMCCLKAKNPPLQKPVVP